MLKRLSCIVGVVLVANAAALAIAARNNSGPPDATLQLTERELGVTDLGTDTTGMTLTLRWNRLDAMPWFDRAKLASLGFDCSVPPDAPNAAARYSGPGLLPRSTYVVFEYDENRIADVGSAAGAPTAESSMGGEPVQKRVPEYLPRLRPVDAGNDPRALRSRYPDGRRYLITAASVRPTLIRGDANQPPRLHGVVMWVEATQVYVPQELQGTVLAAVGKDVQRFPGPLTRAPRYQVTLEYGNRWLPRVVGVRPLK